MTEKEFKKQVELIKAARASGHEELERQLSWALWQELEGPRFTYPDQEEEEV